MHISFREYDDHAIIIMLLVPLGMSLCILDVGWLYPLLDQSAMVEQERRGGACRVVWQLC